MYKVFINGIPLVITSSASNFEQKRGVEKWVFISKNDFEADLKKSVKNWNKEVWVFAFDLERCWHVFKKCFRIISAGGGIVENDKGQVLYIYRRKKWDLPKGKTEDNESIEETALREVEEECGILADLLEPEIFKTTYHIYKQRGIPILKESHWFLMRLQKNSPPPNPQLEEEIEKVAWVDVDMIPSLYHNSFHNIVDLSEAYLAFKEQAKVAS